MKKVFFFIAAVAFFLSEGCVKKENQQGQPPAGQNPRIEYDYDACWSVVGSAGTIDGPADTYVLGIPIGFFIPPEEDPLSFNLLNLSFDGVASIRANIEKTNASIRFNIGSLPEVSTQAKVLRVRYLVTDKRKQRLLVILKKYSLSQPPASETAEVVKIFDSNAFAASPDFQTHSVNLPRDPALGTFDFANYAYFIEAVFIRSGFEQPNLPQVPNNQKHAAPALGIVSICDRAED